MGVYLWKLTLRYWLASLRQLDKSQDSWDKGQEMYVTACLGQQNVLQTGEALHKGLNLMDEIIIIGG